MNTPNPVTPSPVTAGAIPWYKSPQQIGLVTTAVSAAVALFPKLGQALGLSSATAVSDAVTNIFGVIALVAPVVGSFIRAKSKVQPLTMTQSGADANSSTVAVLQTQIAMRRANIPTAVETQAKIDAAPIVTPSGNKLP
jgi:formylmethanofuran:tetrahydromethanopterin formyltransferase